MYSPVRIVLDPNITSTFHKLCRIGGAGYRQMSTIGHRRSRRWERAWAIYSKASGLPLNPYIRGYIIDFLRNEMKPTELSVIPEYLFVLSGMRDFLEWSCLRSWVQSWLTVTGTVVRLCLTESLSSSSLKRLSLIVNGGRSVLIPN